MKLGSGLHAHPSVACKRLLSRDCAASWRTRGGGYAEDRKKGGRASNEQPPPTPLNEQMAANYIPHVHTFMNHMSDQ